MCEKIGRNKIINNNIKESIEVTFIVEKMIKK